MSEPRMVPAYCAGRPVTVAVRPSPPDHRRVWCASCGAKMGEECKDLESKGTLWTGHATRRAADDKLHGGGLNAG